MRKRATTAPTIACGSCTAGTPPPRPADWDGETELNEFAEIEEKAARIRASISAMLKVNTDAVNVQIGLTDQRWAIHGAIIYLTGDEAIAAGD